MKIKNKVYFNCRLFDGFAETLQNGKIVLTKKDRIHAVEDLSQLDNLNEFERVPDFPQEIADILGGHFVARIKTAEEARNVAIRNLENGTDFLKTQYADFVVMDGDPLEDVTVTRNIQRVIKGGVEFVNGKRV